MARTRFHPLERGNPWIGSGVSDVLALLLLCDDLPLPPEPLASTGASEHLHQDGDPLVVFSGSARLVLIGVSP